ncbi:Nif3-like dinuclear metal center hexameric protein [Desulfospira joergensenii]|uniref:Nif3-like dinuclear metal center hexameric protein n=1 Tax=Desulfospira joergensenii TaxID=53329 RepID=UPI0003B332FB|nr:Nif3-like dinuclear metal center hexameric protein [Desulfospira joergensenii]
MGLTARDILSMVDGFAPFDLAENWDNSGLQSGNLAWPVKKILVSLDITLPVMEAAASWGADLVLSHHPLMMNPEKRIDFGAMPGQAIAISAREKICILSAHTNLDKALNGLNDHFAGIIGLENLVPFYSPPGSFPREEEPAGLGRIGDLGKNIRLKDLVEDVKKRLGLDRARVTGDLEGEISRVAVCTGSGGSLVQEFLDSSAQLYITGDLKYHDARQIQAGGKASVDVGHFGSEIIAVDLLTQQLEQAGRKRGTSMEVKGFNREKDPFIIV